MKPFRPIVARPLTSQAAIERLIVTSLTTFALRCARNVGPPTQTSFWQTSSAVHSSPSSHEAPSGCGMCWPHPASASHGSSVQDSPSLQSSGVPAWQPRLGSHVSTPLQAFASSQTTGVPAEHCPFWQLPPVVQASPQDVPFGTKVSAGHGAAVPSHVSATSHTVASGRQTVPLACGGCVHVPVPLHTSSVHELPS